MILYPPAKINLGLYVVSQRDDGFHSIETLFYPLGLQDILEFVPNINEEGAKDCLSLSGLSIPGVVGENLLLKACELYREHVPIPPISLHLHKRIPMGAGLGGGSADASYLLRGLNAEFGGRLSQQELAAMALEIGSDCPYFLCSGPAIGRGRGELLESSSLNLSGYYFYLFHPGIHVSTKKAYHGVSLFAGIPGLEDIISRGPGSWRGALLNSFESSVFKEFPAIASLKDELYASGAIYAAMSGSGSAVFGLFDKQTELSSSLLAQLVWSECID